VQEIMKGEVMILITGSQALDRLILDCKFPEERARRVLNIAWEFGQKAEPCPGGYVHVWYHGKDDTGEHVYSVVEHISAPGKKALALPDEKRYTQHKHTTQQPRGAGKETKMARTATASAPAARRGRKPAPEPEPEQNGEAPDLQRYLTKPLTPTMEDYVEWFETEVAELRSLSRDLPRILYLGVTLYKHFQESEFNQTRRDERRAERASAAPPEPEPAKPARGRGRPAAASTEPASTNGARRGRKPAAAAEPATPARRGRKPAAEKPAAKPATTRGRGRGRAADESDVDSPF
jgi:hypothetical protein